MAAISNAFDAFLDLAQAELAATDEPGEQLRRLALLHLTSLGSDRNLATVFQTELRQSARFLAQFSQHELKRYFDLIRAVVRSGQRRGTFRPELPEKIVANCFFGALDEMVTSCLLLGAVDVPIYPTLTAEQMAYMLANSGARMVFVSSGEQLGKVQQIRGQCKIERIVVMDEVAGGEAAQFSALVAGEPINAEAIEAQGRGIRPDDLATIIYTSGTTGTPKGAM